MTRPGAGLLPGGLDGIVSRGLLKSKVVKISCLFRSILRSSILNDQPFSAERKNGHFSVIPARTGSVVILGHFFDTEDMYFNKDFHNSPNFLSSEYCSACANW